MIRAVLIVVLAALLLAALARHGLAELGDIVLARKAPGADDIPPAAFSHSVHRAQFKCYVCHDALFQMKAGANTVTMDAISQGQYCGACHNGKTAFAVTFETCVRCHRK